MKIKLTKEAIKDFDSSYLYYLNISEKLANSFYKIIDSSIKHKRK